MAIYVDADACPVKKEIVRVAERHNSLVWMVSNSLMRLPESPLIKRIVVSDKFDAADDWIVDRVTQLDVVITSDITLASRCIKKKAAVVSHAGHLFDEQNIGNALAMRELKSQLREMGEILDQKASFSKVDRSRFLQKMEECLQALK
tara:strand:+ start:5260 stop:5700 length:441 start_codon:yes stop_codon:yes gene_type:complete